jgi:hypothetical protein
MIQRCIVVLAVLSLISCKKSFDRNALPFLLDLAIIDSVLVVESDFYLNGLHQVEMVGDSLIGVSSYKSPSVGFFHVSGKQHKRIASGDYPIGSFSPSYFDASDYPVVYILDSKSESILVFDVNKQEFLKKIKLDLPENKKIRFLGSRFKKLDDNYLVELISSKYNNYQPDFYREDGSLVYIFGKDGKIIENSFIEYPKEYKEIEGTLSPSNYLSMGSIEDQIIFTFPHSKRLCIYSSSGKLLDTLSLPKSRFFDYALLGANQIVDFNDMFKSKEMEKPNIPNNDYFLSLFSSNDNMIIQTWMNNGEIGPAYATYCHLFVYDMNKKIWSETSKPRNLLDIGMLAGVVNDTLYFYEGSLMNSDEKYIKRAVLKPIDDL